MLKALALRLPRWLRRRPPPPARSPAFDAVVDLDLGSLPLGLAPDKAMVAVQDDLSRQAGLRRLRVRAGPGAVEIAVRLFAPGTALALDGPSWSAVRDGLIEAAAKTLAAARAKTPPPARTVPGFAEASSTRYADGLAALEMLAHLTASVAPPPVPALPTQALPTRAIPAPAASEPLPAAESDVARLARLLGFVLPVEDRVTARRALHRFGSYAAVLAAPASELSQIPGLGPHSVAAIRLVHEAAVRLGRAGVAARSVLSDRVRLDSYLAAAMARERVEQFRVLFLDTRGMLLADEVQARGTVNHTPVYPREVVRRALELGAAALVLVHNHPSGDPTPSDEDIAMTRQIGLAAAALQIELRDHVIVGNGRTMSLRDAGLMV